MKERKVAKGKKRLREGHSHQLMALNKQNENDDCVVIVQNLILFQLRLVKI